MADFQKKLRPIINNPKVSKSQILAFIKKEVLPGEYEKAIDSLQLLRKIRLRGTRFNSIEDISLRDSYEFTGDLKKELTWILYEIKKESTLIQTFLNKKLDFEKLFVTGKYEEAEKILTEVTQQFGQGLWTLEMSLLLKEYNINTKENWSELSKYLSKIRIPVYEFLLSFYSKRMEENMSFVNTFAHFQNDFDFVNGDQIVKDFLVFKSVPIAKFKYNLTYLESVLWASNCLNTTDQYLLVIDALMTITTITDQNDRTISNFLKKAIIEIPNDFRLWNLLNFTDSSTDLKKSQLNDIIIPLMNLYTSGRFSECKTLCAKKLESHTTCFEIYELYIKSIINLNIPFETTAYGGMVDVILKALHQTLLFDKDSNEARAIILKHSMVLLNWDLGKKMYAFISELNNHDDSNKHQLISCFCSQINNPKILTLDIDGRKNNISEKFSSTIQGPTISIALFTSGYKEYMPTDIAGYQKTIYLARHFFSQRQYDNVVNLLEDIFTSNIPKYYYDNALYLLFESYIEINKLEDAIKLTGGILSNDDFFTSRIRIEKLTQKIDDAGIEKYAHLIETPIVYSDSSSDYDLYAIFDEFMITQGESHPSKLNISKITEQFSVKKVIYFLNEVCIPSTLRYSLEFTSIDATDIERIDICTILKEIDPENKDLYEKEMADILRSGAVRKAIKQVDSGRLYVNIESLKNISSSNAKETFTRYKEIESATQNISLIGFNASKERNWNIQDNQLSSQLQNYNNPAFLAFKAIYLDTREKFIYSKEYGLESCLSTRIRHGTLKNHLRSVFEKVNLVTMKNGDDYLDNLKWAEQLALIPSTNKLVQSRLKSFSNMIDTYTTYIVDSLMQVQTERRSDKSEGLFNFSTSDALLYDFFNSAKSTFKTETDLIDRIYLELAATTSIHISPTISNFFKSEVKNRFQNEITNLQNDIRNLNIQHPNDLLSAIAKSSTDIQIELDNISNWFTFSTTDSRSLLDVETLINASKEYTNRINPNFSIEPTIINDYNSSILASSHMIFVFNILLNNVIKHSKLEAAEIQLTIHIKKHQDCIEIMFRNNLSDNVNIEISRQKLENVKLLWNNNQKIERSNVEGESGFDKIKRILLYDAGAKMDKFEYSISSNTVSISLFLPFKEITNE